MNTPNDPNNPDWSGINATTTSNAEITGGSGAGGGEGEQSYTVEKGDTLSGISKQFYGSANHWKEIFEANRDQLDNPDLIKPGQVLKIPARAE